MESMRVPSRSKRRAGRMGLMIVAGSVTGVTDVRVRQVTQSQQLTPFHGTIPALGVPTIDTLMEVARMKKITLAAALVLAPMLAHGQSATGGGSGVTIQSRTRADVTATKRAKSENPGRAGASANASAQSDLTISHDALVHAGHTRPTDQEVRLGARLPVRG